MLVGMGVTLKKLINLRAVNQKKVAIYKRTTTQFAPLKNLSGYGPESK